MATPSWTRGAFWAAWLALSTSGCATVFNGTRHNLRIESEPPGASVIVRSDGDGSEPREVGPTPFDFEADASHDYYFELRSPGREARRITVHHVLGVQWVVLDFILSGWIGILVDGLSGAWFSPDNDKLMILLEPERAPSWESIPVPGG